MQDHTPTAPQPTEEQQRLLACVEQFREENPERSDTAAVRHCAPEKTDAEISASIRALPARSWVPQARR